MERKPQHGTSKLNCDIATGDNSAYVAVVARDWRGVLVFANVKKVDTNILAQAEEAIH